MKLCRQNKNLILRVFALAIVAPPVFAQLPLSIHQGDAVPREVREIYERGLTYLADSQQEDGSWQGGYQGPGVTGMAMMCFLAAGEDPNFGPYSQTIRKAVRNIVDAQDAKTGYFGDSMYHHGFAMLAMAEAYGAVDDSQLWRSRPGAKEQSKKSIGNTLELAVRSAVTSQKKNPLAAWRYSPDATDADTSVSGAVMVGLLAARNAGIEVPDESIDGAIKYFASMTSDSGSVGYSGGFGGGFGTESIARTSIATLVFAVAKCKDLPQYKAAIGALTSNLEAEASNWKDYGRYYQSQALFQGDMEAWEKWNRLLIDRLKGAQADDGSFAGDLGPTVSTSLSLLSLALNFRFLPIYER